MEIYGFCAPGLEPLYDTFAANFRECGDSGAAFAVRQHGELVVSLWAGSADRNGETPYTEDTLANVFSSSKGVLALLVLQQVAEGRLDLDRPVADYWPEFAAAGKAQVTARQLLCHRAGLVAFREKVADSLIYDWPGACAQVAATEPWWEPGSKQGYAPFLYGWSLGGLLERVAATGLLQLYRQGLGGTLDLDGGFGAVGHKSSRIADVGPLKQPLPELRENAVGRAIKEDRKGPVAMAFTNPMSLMMGTNSAEWRGALIPAANGHFSARDLATIYGDLAAEQPRTLPQVLVEEAGREQSRGRDAVLQAEVSFGCGYILSGRAADLRFGGEHGFGHPGAGGSVGFADPDRGLGCGYVTTRLGQSLFMDRRSVRLVEHLYQLL
ncbi:serine hydrolase domain-containing protein [Microbulbifer thermotolerans]|uniref:serine hydrolase domain-containing protein n=1 Tax=Microbulbifer thermotolerans TaxID=252514 RepID=UPI0022487E1D|nr:serine hydrolase domain-containing protein [Microbulbifer thermotolerans]MCX2780992.1 beta-lactamase family protein [Microbulbifer thermotolerans]MCX2806519.1 beta-lactamase family protein [Microbulbifer thermotolerans]MCX2832695.1 beta-lactamase family protein [Microbulbifer thermotolerans]MCX2842827.1 beta-lactamase family protein [Microbulbifer thermotolerans]